MRKKFYVETVTFQFVISFFDRNNRDYMTFGARFKHQSSGWICNSIHIYTHVFIDMQQYTYIRACIRNRPVII